VVALASLLTYAPQTNPILLSWLGKVVGIKNQAKLTESIPFALMQAVFLAVVFYLMVNLFHRALYILRNYRYLGHLESEIRAALKLNDSDHSFTRESRFYWSDRSWVLGTVKFVYVVFLGVLLLAFLGGRLYADWRNWLLVAVDLGLAIPTFGYFLAFSYYSVGLDRQREDYDLHLMSVDRIDDLKDKGCSSIIVALSGADLHFRIFNTSGEKVFDKAEIKLRSGKKLKALRRRLEPFPDESILSQEVKEEIIRNVTSIAGLTKPKWLRKICRLT
jgi:hypothetical protein